MLGHAIILSVPKLVSVYFADVIPVGTAEEVEVEGDQQWLQPTIQRASEGGFANLYGAEISRLKQLSSELREHQVNLEHLIVERTAEARLVHEEAVAEANLTKTEFLDNISHVLRTPVHAVSALQARMPNFEPGRYGPGGEIATVAASRGQTDVVSSPWSIRATATMCPL